MLKWIGMLAISLFGALQAGAQNRVYLCQSYNEATGQPIGESSAWRIQEGGGLLYALFRSDSAISTKNLHLYIDYQEDKTYSPYATHVADYDSLKNWVLFDCLFDKAGDYRVTVVDDAKQVLAQEYCSIYLIIGQPAETEEYYAESEVVFCDKLSNSGKPVKILNTFTLPKNNTKALLYIDNKKPFLTDEILIHVKKSGITIDSQRIPVKSSESSCSYLYTFVGAGSYQIEVYTKEEIYINETSVVIKTKK